MRERARILHMPYPELLPLWAAVFIDVLGFSILIPFLPFFSQAYDAPPEVIGLLLSTNALFGFFSGPIWGSLSDRYGRKPILLICQLGTLAGFLLMAFSNNMVMLFASRVVDGVFGGNFPIAKAIIGDVVPPAERSKHLSNIGVAYVLSSLLGPVLGGLLSRRGILIPGLLSASLTCITVSLTAFFLKESNPLYKQDTEHATSSPGPGIQNSPKHEGIWRNATARYLLVQWGFHTLSFTTYIASIALFASLRLGLDARQMGFLLMGSGAVRVFIRFVIFVPLLRHLGDRRTSLLGLSVFVVAFFLLAFVRNQVQFGLILCMASFGAACTRGVLTSFLSRAVKPWQQGKAMGTSASLDSLAQIAGPLIGGFVLGYLPLWVFGCLTSGLALGALAMALRRLTLYQG